jgi:hypothetical protein
MAKTLRDRLAELAAQEVLVLPVDHDRRGFYVLPKDDPAPPRSDDAVPRRPYIRV